MSGACEGALPVRIFVNDAFHNLAKVYQLSQKRVNTLASLMRAGTP